MSSERLQQRVVRRSKKFALTMWRTVTQIRRRQRRSIKQTWLRLWELHCKVHRDRRFRIHRLTQMSRQLRIRKAWGVWRPSRRQIIDHRSHQLIDASIIETASVRRSIEIHRLRLCTQAINPVAVFFRELSNPNHIEQPLRTVQSIKTSKES